MFQEEYNHIEAMELWDLKKKRLNRALKGKSPFTFVQSVLNEVLPDPVQEIMFDYGSIELDFINLTDENIIKLFQSFNVTRMDNSKLNAQENYYIENIVSLMMRAYYYSALNRTHLMGTINSIISLNRLIEKLKVEIEKNNITLKVSAIDLRKLLESMVAEEEERIFVQLIEEFVLENTYTISWDNEEVAYGEGEIKDDFVDCLTKLVEWTYNLYTNIYTFYKVPVIDNSEIIFQKLAELIEHYLYECMNTAVEYNGYDYVHMLNESIDELIKKIPNKGEERFIDLMYDYKRKKEGAGSGNTKPRFNGL